MIFVLEDTDSLDPFMCFTLLFHLSVTDGQGNQERSQGHQGAQARDHTAKQCILLACEGSLLLM